MNWRSRWAVLLGLALLAYLAGSVAITLTKAPWWDEGLFASPVYHLATQGFMGSSVWVSQYNVRSLPGIEKHVYTWMPLYPVVLAGWIKLFSYAIVTMRLFSAAWGLVALAAWYVIMLAFTKRHEVAVLTVILIATDYNFISEAALARYDTMPCALGFAGWAAFLAWREQHFNRAVFAGSALVAASIFSHPMGLLHFAGLLILILYLDWHRIRVRTVLLAAIPFVVFTAGWGLYILQSPEDFRGQFLNHSAHRVGGIESPWRALSSDFTQRYVFAFWTSLQGLNRLKVLVVLLYIAGIFGTLCTSALRKLASVRILLVLSAIYYLGIALLDTLKSPHYFIQLFPLLLALTAIWVDYVIRYHVRWRPAVVVGVAGLVAIQLGGVAMQARADTWRNVYDPVVAYVQQHSSPDSLIIGPAELTFGLGMNANLKDDARLGYGTGWSPDLIVSNEFYVFDYFRQHEPSVYAFIQNRLTNQYRLVYTRDKYAVYAKRSDLARSPGANEPAELRPN